MAMHCQCRPGETTETTVWSQPLCRACFCPQADVDRVSRMQHDPMMGRKNVSGLCFKRLPSYLGFGFVARA